MLKKVGRKISITFCFKLQSLSRFMLWEWIGIGFKPSITNAACDFPQNIENYSTNTKNTLECTHRFVKKRKKKNGKIRHTLTSKFKQEEQGLELKHKKSHSEKKKLRRHEEANTNRKNKFFSIVANQPNWKIKSEHNNASKFWCQRCKKMKRKPTEKWQKNNGTIVQKSITGMKK